ncbi:MAG: M23 family metallopeptidase [Treponema sp.]|nr:M23 family metallopeptidase [Treponema sp.]
MKKIVISHEICYSESDKMKVQFKNVLYGTLSATAAALLVLGVTLAVMHQNTKGQGGLETPGLPELTEHILETDSDFTSDLFTVQDDIEDRQLSYASYRVKKGDMIGAIAEQFDITQDTIISVNNIRQSRLIQIGQYLKIPSMPGILYTVKANAETPASIAQKYSVDAEKCAAANNLSVDTELQAGRTLFVPDAALDWVTRQEINGDLFIKPLRARFYYSSWYGWRKSPFNAAKRTFHNGIDMACPKGTSIYAALVGKVTTAGWSDVYGNYVIVTHHSGYKTLYGHMSQILVAKGQNVTTSTRLGLVGSTGMSTGPHLHFTVFKNGKTVNPTNLWK